MSDNGGSGLLSSLPLCTVLALTAPPLIAHRYPTHGSVPADAAAPLQFLIQFVDILCFVRIPCFEHSIQLLKSENLQEPGASEFERIKPLPIDSVGPLKTPLKIARFSS